MEMYSGVDDNPNGSIHITTYFEGVASPQRILVFDRFSGDIVASGKSKEDGTFRRYVGNIYTDERKVMVVTLDDTATYNAEIADHVNSVI